MPDEYYSKPQEALPKKSNKKLILIPIVIIVLVGAYYVYTQSPMARYDQSLNEFNEASDTVNEAVSGASGGTGDSFAIISLSQRENLKVTVRNSGANDIDSEKITATIDGIERDVIDTAGILSPGEYGVLSFESDLSSCGKTLTLDYSWLSVSETINC